MRPTTLQGMGGLEGEGDRVIVTHMLSGVIELFVSDLAVLCPQTCWPGPDPPQHCPGSHCFCGSGSGQTCGNCSASLSSHHSTPQPAELGQTAGTQCVPTVEQSNELPCTFSLANKHVSLSCSQLPETPRRWAWWCARHRGWV